MRNEVLNYLETLSKTLNDLQVDEIVEVANTFIKARDTGKTIYTMGNGGSGSTASHIVCDIIKGCSYGKERKFKIICLNDNIPTVLAYANDISYDVIFEEQLKNLLHEGDVVLGISGSGNSKNIINAINYANLRKATTIGFTGYDGGILKKISKLSVNVGVNDMQISEDIHVVTLHILYKLLENA